MARETEELLISLRADLNQFEKNFAKAHGITVGQMRRIQREVEKSATGVERAMGRVGASIKSGLVGALSAVTFGSLVSGVTELINKFAELADEAARAGVSAEFLQELGFAGIGAGVKVNQLVDLIQKFNLEIGEAATKGGPLKDLLDANNVSLRDANGQIRTTQELFYIVVDLIKNARTQQEAAVVAQIAMGKAAKDALPFLIQGADAIRAQMQAAKDTNAVLTNEMIAAIDEVADKWAYEWALFEGHSAKAIVATIGYLQQLDAWIKQSTFHRVFGRGGLVHQAMGGAGIANGSATGAGGMFDQNQQISNAGAKGDFTVIPKTIDLEAIKRAQQQAEAIEKLIADLEFEREQLNETALQQEINNALRQAGTTVTEEQRQAIIGNVTAIYNWKQATEEAIEAGEDWKQKQKEIEEQAKELKDAYQELGEMGFDAMWSWATGAQSAKESLRELTMQLAKLAIQAALFGTGPFATIGGNEGGGIFNALVSGLTARASGGPVNAGQPYMVGERGRELFVPSQSGRIVPNGAMRGSGYGNVIIQNMGAQIERSERSGVNGKDLILTIRNVARADFAENLQKHAPLIGGRPASKRTS